MKTFKAAEWDTDANGDNTYQELFKKSKNKRKKSKSKFLAGKVEKDKKQKIKLKKLLEERHTNLKSNETTDLLNIQSNSQKITKGQKNKIKRQQSKGVKQETVEQLSSGSTGQKERREKLKYKKSKEKVPNKSDGGENGITKAQKKMLKKFASELNSLNEHSEELSSEMLREKKRQRKLEKKLKKARKKETLLSKIVEITTKGKSGDSKGAEVAKKTKKKKILNAMEVTEKETLLDSDTSNKKKKKKQKKHLKQEMMLHSEYEDGQNKQEKVMSKVKKNKLREKLKTVLSQTEAKQNKPIVSLRQKMMEKLKAARFRFLNEQIYTTDSKEAQRIFKSDPEAFNAYHEGYRQQIRSWPLNPLDVIIKSIKNMPKTHSIADFGCGDAKLAKSVHQKVYSFDLIAVDDTVTACDMTKVPLEDGKIDVAVFCLSLMGTNLHDYLLEANRVLKIGGILKIAEVESRFDDVDNFIEGVQRFGFKKVWKDLSHNLFYFLDFKKDTNVKNKKKLPTISLLPCLYKKR